MNDYLYNATKQPYLSQAYNITIIDISVNEEATRLDIA